MLARFLLGPAGSGKTCRCVDEVRAALRASPDGPPLLFLAPKQATFQLERQLLATPDLPGYTRLHILSFERLAQLLLESTGTVVPKLLAEEGRLMVLRALLTRHREELSVFRATARLTGFAGQVNLLLREFQRHQVTPDRLARLASSQAADATLAGKLTDLARLLRLYLDWLERHELQDADCLLDVAAAGWRASRTGTAVAPRFGGLWLDGFAEMTPQELDLLAAVLPDCAQATLAFCLDTAPTEAAHWLSIWAPVGESFRQLRERLAGTAGCEVVVETLARSDTGGRFAASPALRHLERCWSAPVPIDDSPGAAVRVVSCANATQEATVAAREILRFVRGTPARFREVAVLVRSLEGYHETIRRVFRRYGIPIFLDRREPVAHHPLAELTRSVLRTVAFGWQHEDWFGALKTGLVLADEAAVDWLENEALARGWAGQVWREPIAVADSPALAERAEQMRARLVPPFVRLETALGLGAPAKPGCGNGEALGQPTGRELADALRELWTALEVESQLNRWADGGRASQEGFAGQAAAQVHGAVWDQMLDWLENVALAFPTGRLPLREWLPILEAGLANLTVGVIPPALDQVLVGAVDRSRNPDLRLVVLLGFNEGVFPARPAAPPILTEGERECLESLGVALGLDTRRQIGRERYYGYIACTRPRERLLATFSRQAADDRPLNPSSFLAQFQRAFPRLVIETAEADGQPVGAEHVSELVAPAWRRLAGGDDRLVRLLGEIQAATGERTDLVHATSAAPSPRPSPPLGERAGVRGTRDSSGVRMASAGSWKLSLDLPAVADSAEALAPAIAEQLYGPAVLTTSVSRLEDFAACPFKFFVGAGLRAGERQRFEADARQLGSFQHEVLRRFHEKVRETGREWRDLTPDEARAQVGTIAAEVAHEFGGGLLSADDGALLTTRGLTEALQNFVGVLVSWMRTSYGANPRAAELAFGFRDAALPAWEITLDGRHKLALVGKVDRVDLAPGPRPGEAWCVVHDYKSGTLAFDPTLFAHGIQMQLPVYLAAVVAGASAGREARGGGGQGTALPAEPQGMAQALALPARLVPAGFFYVSLRGRLPGSEHRDEALTDPAAEMRSAYEHHGRFRADALAALDAEIGGQPSGQFKFKRTKDGGFNARLSNPLTASDFESLLTAAEVRMRELGDAIFSGVAKVDPFQKGASLKACDSCRFQAVCRIDPWSHQYRRLTAARR